MTLRNNLSLIKRQAHEVLDAVRAGIQVPQQRILWALLQTGDLS
jgi:hypothetical protein